MLLSIFADCIAFSKFKYNLYNSVFNYIFLEYGVGVSSFIQVSSATHLALLAEFDFLFKCMLTYVGK